MTGKPKYVPSATVQKYLNMPVSPWLQAAMDYGRGMEEASQRTLKRIGWTPKGEKSR